MTPHMERRGGKRKQTGHGLHETEWVITSCILQRLPAQPGPHATSAFHCFVLNTAVLPLASTHLYSWIPDTLEKRVNCLAFLIAAGSWHIPTELLIPLHEDPLSPQLLHKYQRRKKLNKSCQKLRLQISICNSQEGEQRTPLNVCVVPAQGAGCERPDRKARHRTDAKAFCTQEKRLRLFPFTGMWPKHSTSHLAALGSSTSRGNYNPQRKTPTIFNRERALHIRRLNTNTVFF